MVQRMKVVSEESLVALWERKDKRLHFTTSGSHHRTDRYSSLNGSIPRVIFTSPFPSHNVLPQSRFVRNALLRVVVEGNAILGRLIAKKGSNLPKVLWMLHESIQKNALLHVAPDVCGPLFFSLGRHILNTMTFERPYVHCRQILKNDQKA
jgi:hypothetical protein